jgi:hypothetical protein
MQLSPILETARRPLRRPYVRPGGSAASGCPPDPAQFVAPLVTSVRDDCVRTPGSARKRTLPQADDRHFGPASRRAHDRGTPPTELGREQEAELLASAAEGRIGLGGLLSTLASWVRVGVGRAAAKIQRQQSLHRIVSPPSCPRTWLGNYCGHPRLSCGASASRNLGDRDEPGHDTGEVVQYDRGTQLNRSGGCP